MNLVKLKIAVLSIFVLSLTACGGGGSSSTGSDSANPTTSSSPSISDDSVDPGSDDSDAGDDVVDEESLSITNQPTSQTLSSDETLSLSLQVSSSATYAVAWYRNGSLVSQSNTYQDANLTVADSGTYTCSVTSGALNEQCASFTVTVLDAPSVTQSPSNQVLTEGGELALTIAAQGSDLSYQWYLDGVAVQGETSNQLSVASVALNQAGDYVCVVTNVVGNDSSLVASVSVMEATVYGSAQVSWDRPTTRSDGSDLAAGEISAYRVYYGLSDENGYAENVQVSANEMAVVLDDLEQGEYKIAVSTVDGDGLESSLSSDFLLAIN